MSKKTYTKDSKEGKAIIAFHDEKEKAAQSALAVIIAAKQRTEQAKKVQSETPAENRRTPSERIFQKGTLPIPSLPGEVVEIWAFLGIDRTKTPNLSMSPLMSDGTRHWITEGPEVMNGNEWGPRVCAEHPSLVLASMERKAENDVIRAKEQDNLRGFLGLA